MKWWNILLCSLVLVVLAGCTLDNSSSNEQETETSEKVPVNVISVMDGDTIKVKYNGELKKVRYLLIDTPEMYHKQLGEQPYGREAQSKNREILNHAKNVSLEFDVGDKEDKYGRLLAYVYADGKSVQEQLVAEGLARVGYIYQPNTKYVNEFKDIQEQAKKKKIGIWRYDGYVTDRGFVKSVVEKQQHTKNSNGTFRQKDNGKSACTIKGNINSKGNKLYHMPGMAQYNNVKPEKTFCTEEEAKKAGFTKAAR